MTNTQEDAANRRTILDTLHRQLANAALLYTAVELTPLEHAIGVLERGDRRRADAAAAPNAPNPEEFTPYSTAALRRERHDTADALEGLIIGGLDQIGDAFTNLSNRLDRIDAELSRRARARDAAREGKPAGGE